MLAHGNATKVRGSPHMTRGLGLLCLLVVTLLWACSDQPVAGPTPQQAGTHAPPPKSTTAPTPTPTPSPTPTPTSTPTPAATPSLTPSPVPSPSLYLNWFDSQEDYLHSSARMSIETIWGADRDLGFLVVRLPWVGDGIAERERQLLEEIAGLAGLHPDLASTVLEYRWIHALDGVGGDAPRAIGSIRAAAATDLDLAHLMAGHHWLEYGIQTVEADALAAIADLAGQEVSIARSLTAASGFAERALRNIPTAAGSISRILQGDPALGLKVAGYPWILDGITDVEVGALDIISELMTPPESLNSGLAGKVVDYSWISDGIQLPEPDDIRMFQQLLEAAESGNSGLAEELAGRPWVGDDLSSHEREAIRVLSLMLEMTGADGFGLVEKLAGYPWVADGIDQYESGGLRRFRDLLVIAGADHIGLVEKVASYRWVADGIDRIDQNELLLYGGLLSTAGADNSRFFEGLMDYSWVADGIFYFDERQAIQDLLRMLEVAKAARSDILEKLTSYPWVADRSSLEERQAIGAFRAMLEVPGDGTLGVVEKLVDYPWVADGITRGEASLIGDLAGIAGQDSQLALVAAEYYNVRGGYLVVRAINSLRQALRIPEVSERAKAQSWLADGLDDEEAALLVTLQPTGGEATTLFTNFLEAHYTQFRSVSLSLVGDVNIWVFQDVPFPRGEDLISNIQDSARIMEEFLGVPFPTTDIILLIPHQRHQAEPGHLGTHMRLNRGHADMVYNIPHETAHYYFYVGPQWFYEGAAQFIEAYVNHVMGAKDLADRRKEVSRMFEAECLRSEWKIENIAQHTSLVETLPPSALTHYLGELSWPGGCSHYLIGENFLLQAFNTLGREALSSALRDLYMLRESGWGYDEEKIYQTFLKNVPPGLEEEFHNLYRKLHGGVFIDP